MNVKTRNVKLYPLSIVTGYSFLPIKKIYSTKWIGVPDLKRVNNDMFVLGKHGEIKLTKACDESLQNQAKKANGNAVLGVHYSISFSTSVSGGDLSTDSFSAVVMYAYGEAGQLLHD